MNAKGLCRLAILTAAAMSATNATLAEILYYEDFASGNAARGVWRESPNGAFFDASSGDYVLTQPDGDTPVYSFVTGIPEVAHLTDTSVRAQVRLDGSSVGTGLFARGGSFTYNGGFNNDSQRLYLGYNDPAYNVLARADFEYDLNAEDLLLQLDVIGNKLSLWAWTPGDEMPSQPQLTYVDEAWLAQAGQPGVLHDPGSPGTMSTVTFRDFQVADSHIPEPSSTMLLLTGLFSIRGACRRKH